MGQGRRFCCGCLFVTKATIAFLLGLGGLSYQSYRIFALHKEALKYMPLPSIAIPEPGSANAAMCYYDSSSRLARLEPPGNHFFWGFDLQWDRDLPSRLISRINRRPAIFK